MRVTKESKKAVRVKEIKAPKPKKKNNLVIKGHEYKMTQNVLHNGSLYEVGTIVDQEHPDFKILKDYLE